MVVPSLTPGCFSAHLFNIINYFYCHTTCFTIHICRDVAPNSRYTTVLTLYLECYFPSSARDYLPLLIQQSLQDLYLKRLLVSPISKSNSYRIFRTVCIFPRVSLSLFQLQQSLRHLDFPGRRGGPDYPGNPRSGEPMENSVVELPKIMISPS